MSDIDPAVRCHYRDSAGRRCRLPRQPGHPTFCSRHAQPAVPARNAEAATDLSAELLGPLTDFRTATSINYTLGRLLILKAADQISARDAATVAYICQLLFQTIPIVRQEMSCSRISHPDYKDLHGVVQATSSLWDADQEPTKAS